MINLNNSSFVFFQKSLIKLILSQGGNIENCTQLGNDFGLGVAICAPKLQGTCIGSGMCPVLELYHPAILDGGQFLI